MKKTICAILLLLVSFGYAFAQQNTLQTVNLKNGSMIRGVILELNPEESVKVQTADGSIYVYPMYDVKSITNDGMSRQESRMYGMGQTAYNPTFAPRGRRGFADFGYTIGTGDFSGLGRLELSGSYGYQFNPYLFLGAGLGLQYCTDDDSFIVPLYADFRVNLLDGRITPFAGLKLGYSFSDISEVSTGFYGLPSVGVRYVVKDDLAVNFSIGYTIQKIEFDYPDYYSYSYAYDYSEWYNWGGVSLKFGLEF